ncbi:MAG TPA: cytochrome c [Acetobacteraceae bacterium]|nr:cytochrome c [Acetobacteraceae bacterium]
MWTAGRGSAIHFPPRMGILMVPGRPLVCHGVGVEKGEIGMTGKLAVLAIVVVATAGVARAEGIDPIETRQAGQDLFAGTYAGIRAVVAAKGDVKTLENPAKAMARWMQQFPTQFPKGSEEGHNTKALPAVWTDNEGFRKTANELAEASTKLAELAKAGDADGVAAQVKAMGDICAACHRTYRAR